MTDLERSAPRRAILAAGLGSLAGLAAAALGRPPVMRAADNDAMLLGNDANASASTTKVTLHTASYDALWVVADGGGSRALRGTAPSGTGVGVFGESGGTGVSGESTGGVGVTGKSTSGTGVYGSGGAVGLYGFGNHGMGVTGVSIDGTGVFGQTSGSNGPGVLGQSASHGTGVVGFSGSTKDVIPSPLANTGVYGYEGATGVGVWGATGGTTGQGVGVKGEAHSPDGIGVSGFGWNGGTGLQGAGRVGVFASSTTDGWMGVWGRHFGAGYGVAGDSISLIGVSGTSDATDHPATVGKSQGNSTGVLGFSGSTGSALPAARPRTGVFGQATQDASSCGVVGVSTSGSGVRGEATSGTALSGAASAKSGYAVRTSGRVRFDKVSGVATIAAGHTTVIVTPGTDVTADSFLLLTAKANIGSRSLSFTTDPTNDRITIRISSSRPSSTPVAWLLLS